MLLWLVVALGAAAVESVVVDSREAAALLREALAFVAAPLLVVESLGVGSMDVASTDVASMAAL